jgi:very-short-patch-repair endonuclease
MAAVLACGSGAVLSHRSAAELWRLLEPGATSVDVTVATAAGRKRRPGLRIHRSAELPAAASTTLKRIAVTTPARTLADLARVASPGLVRRATRQADYLGLPLGQSASDRTRSELERSFLALCRRHRLPPPLVNVRIGAYRVDFLWAASKLIVETDGYAAHRGRQAFEDDRVRDAVLQAAGYSVLRLSHAQVTREVWTTVATLRAMLARPG